MDAARCGMWHPCCGTARNDGWSDFEKSDKSGVGMHHLPMAKTGRTLHGVARPENVILDQDLMDENQAAALSSAALLIEAVGRGSRAALKRLYELESRRLYGIALRIVRRPEIASEVLQEAFIQVWQNARTFSAERGAGSAWLTGIVRFRSLDVVRKLGREILVDDPTLGDAPLETDMIEQIDAKAGTIALRRCLALLDENQRRCVVLAFVDGFSHAEIAQRLATPLGSVKSWVRRGLLALRSCLES